ncbi:hypothetical protein F4804DRAFT_333529 [Jackrogersella minutella]|nr:hypothetical protein F4804DRAFT_333529 [Jackrogersella minutella]
MVVEVADGLFWRVDGVLGSVISLSDLSVELSVLIALLISNIRCHDADHMIVV